MANDLFEAAFEALYGRRPFPWQRRLYAKLASGEVPSAIDIPTGLGKTAIIAIWLIALAEQARVGAVTLPRRLVYVVDRRTVVDQATDVAAGIRKALAGAGEDTAAGRIRAALSGLCGDVTDKASPLAISTLRGEFADNREWQADPARATIIVGTVDMIGSRLLFSGYGVSRKMRPFHAGLLGQDSLIVHDEAHLSPAFGKLIKGIETIQKAANEPRAIRVMELSATQRDGSDAGASLGLEDGDYADRTVTQRLDATKILRLHELAESAKLEDELAARALARGASLARVLVYVRSPDMARKVATQIEASAGKGTAAILTGTMRGYERDILAADPKDLKEKDVDPVLVRRAEIFHGFKARAGRAGPDRTTYLVATSAGEVGIDLDADLMVCDLTELDSMIQRLGRVNRLGEGNATIDVIVAPASKDDAESTDRDLRIKATRAALATLPTLADGGHDASPRTLRGLIGRLGGDGIAASFSPVPLHPALTRALVDAWSMTSLKEHPGRPEVAPWLRGWVKDEQRTRLVWRRVLPIRPNDDEKLIKIQMEAFFEVARPHASEVLDNYTSAIAKLLQDRAKALLKRGDAAEASESDDGETEDAGERETGTLNGRSIAAIVLDSSGDFERHLRLADIAQAKVEALKGQIVGRTVVVDARLGGLDGTGHLAAAAQSMPPTLDGLGQSGWPEDLLRRIGYRVRMTTADAADADWKVVYHRTIGEETEDADDTSAMEWRVEQWVGEGAGGAEPAQAREDQSLDLHLACAELWMEEIAQRLSLPEDEVAVFLIAAALHDLGKARRIWQGFAGNPGFRGTGGGPPPLAKFKGRADPNRLKIGDATYRHEFGSLRDAREHRRMSQLADGDRERVLHLIATHHGNGRPLIEPIDERDPPSASLPLAREVALRFVRMQTLLGPWGLAWREALLRSADFGASGMRNADVETRLAAARNRATG